MCICRLDTRTLSRDSELTLDSASPPVRIFNGDFLIGQFVPSRSDEHFHDGVVSPSIRLRGYVLWFCVHKPCRVFKNLSSRSFDFRGAHCARRYQH